MKRHSRRHFRIHAHRRLPAWVFVAAVGFAAGSFGCSGNENTVIQPGEPYELNEQEQANLELEEKMRAEAR